MFQSTKSVAQYDLLSLVVCCMWLLSDTGLVVSLDSKDLIKYSGCRGALIIFVKRIDDCWLCSNQ